MSSQHFGQRVEPGSSDHESVERSIERARARHRAICGPDCACTEKVRVETIRDAWAVDDVAGAPVGITETTTPMVSITFKKETNPHE